MEPTQQQSAIEKAIFAYEDAFNSADIPRSALSFISEGVLMPNNGPVAKGTDQITASFEFLLSAFQINIRYTIDEIIVSGEYAYVRTNSVVKTSVKASGERILLDNKELFILYNSGEKWKISHYIFNNTKTNK